MVLAPAVTVGAPVLAPPAVTPEWTWELNNVTKVELTRFLNALPAFFKMMLGEVIVATPLAFTLAVVLFTVTVGEVIVTLPGATTLTTCPAATST